MKPGNEAMPFDICIMYSELQLCWKIIFPFLAKSHAHMQLYMGVYAHGHETLQGMGK